MRFEAASAIQACIYFHWREYVIMRKSRGKSPLRIQFAKRVRSQRASSLRVEFLESRHLLSGDALFRSGFRPDPITPDPEPHDVACVVWAPDTPQSVVDVWEANSNEEEPGFAAAGADINEVDGERWTQTATNGSGLGQGDPSTITWSIMPDGTRLTGSRGKASGPSDLRARLNSIYGSMSNWLPLFQQVFDRWEAVSGINFVYEPADDGAHVG